MSESATIRDPGRLGAQLREARTLKKISLREMGRRVGVSASFMSQVELGRATPSIGTLYAMVSELGLSLDSLMDEGRRSTAPAPTKIVPTPLTGSISGLQRVGARPEISMAGVRWERLTEEDDPLVEFLRVTYSAGSESCPADSMMRHSGHEYMHVLSGRLNVQVGFNGETMAAGDSLNFNSTIPHRLSNPFNEDCVALWVVIGRQGFTRPMDFAAGQQVAETSPIAELGAHAHSQHHRL